MEFEFNEEKSESNKQKHGIDFYEAQTLWDDDDLLVIKAYTQGENRFAAIAQIREKHWTAIFTYRSENIRLISVRRSRPKEVELYETN